VRRTLAILALVVAMAACGDGEGAGEVGPTATGAEQTATGAEQTAPPSSSEAVTTPLEGTWAIERVTASEALATIREHGFGRHELRVFLDDLGASDWFGLTLKFSGQDYTLFGSPDGGDLTPVDYGSTFTVEGDILTLVYSAPGGTTTFRWTIAGDRLELELFEDDQADYLGLPTEIWVSGLYTVEPFVRVEP
jgi:hypothetical protein